MRTISTNLQNHIAGQTTTLAMCWLLTLVNGTKMGFTSHDQSLTISGVVYEHLTGFTPSNIKGNSDFSVDNLEVDSFLSSDRLKEVDITAGIYDYAAISVFLVNYNDLTMGELNVRTGWLGQVSMEKSYFTAELRGIIQKLQGPTGRIYSPSCDAALGDSRCTVNLTPFTFTAAVTQLIDNGNFIAGVLTQIFNYFTGGKVTWTSGLNNGLSMEVKAFSSRTVELGIPMPYSIQLGDSFNIVAGCDKSKATCLNTFNNLVNFRGFPSIPGMNTMLTTAGTVPKNG